MRVEMYVICVFKNSKKASAYVRPHKKSRSDFFIVSSHTLITIYCKIIDEQ